MKIVVITPMYNEIGHIDVYFKNILVDNVYDDIVILDDGSTDGTWDVLQEYAKKHNNVHIYRNDVNSIINHGSNRWMVLSEKAAKFEPTWINARAADTVYVYGSREIFRNRLRLAIEQEVYLLCLPWVNIWRSDTWYRCDNIWGTWAHTHAITSIWRFHKDFKWHPTHMKAGMHQGFVRPTFLGFPLDVDLKLMSFNEVTEKPWKTLILHYGMYSDALIIERFHKNMKESEAAHRIGRSFGMPPPSLMPPIRHWPRCNGYMAFYEFNMQLKRVSKTWFTGEIDTSEPKPSLLDLYEVIKEYNSTRSEEFKRMYNERGGQI